MSMPVQVCDRIRRRRLCPEVVSMLENLHHQLVTEEDIPFIMSFLGTATGDEEQAIRRWYAYWRKIDLEFRRRALARNPHYITDPPPK